MQPPLSPSRLRRRNIDDSQQSAAEAKSWAPVTPPERARVYTHNAEHFARRDAEVEAVVEEDAEPALRPPPTWMLLLAGAAIAALLGALLGGFFLEF